MNPDGDKDAVAQVRQRQFSPLFRTLLSQSVSPALSFLQAWCMLRPGGILALGLPMVCNDEGLLVFNAHRIYGFERLAYISQNFVLEGFFGPICTTETIRNAGEEWTFQQTVVLRKPYDLDAPVPALVAGDFLRQAL